MAPLIAIGAALLPSIIDAVAGDKAGRVAGHVVDAVRTATGTEDPVEARAAVNAMPPEQRVALETRLAEIALEARRDELADVADARAYGQAVPLVAYTQVGLVVGVGVVWGFLIVRAAMWGIPVNVSPETYGILMSVAGALFGALVQFFIGNSTAAHAANQRLDRLAAGVGQGAGQPAAIATTAPVTVNPPSPPGTTADDLNADSLARARGTVAGVRG